MPGALDDLAKHVEALLGHKLVRHQVALGEVTVIVAAEDVAEVLAILRDDGQCQFEQLVDICGATIPSAPSALTWSIICSPRARISAFGSSARRM